MWETRHKMLRIILRGIPTFETCFEAVVCAERADACGVLSMVNVKKFPTVSGEKWSRINPHDLFSPTPRFNRIIKGSVAGMQQKPVFASSHASFPLENMISRLVNER